MMMDDVTVSQSQSQFEKRDTPHLETSTLQLCNLLIIKYIYNIYNIYNINKERRGYLKKQLRL